MRPPLIAARSREFCKHAAKLFLNLYKRGLPLLSNHGGNSMLNIILRSLPPNKHHASLAIEESSTPSQECFSHGSH